MRHFLLHEHYQFPSSLTLQKQVAAMVSFFAMKRPLPMLCRGTPTLNEYRGSRLDYSVPVIVGNSLAQINTVDHGRFLLQTDLKSLSIWM
jgi:hypothetical protein